jgi:hypothetical protein
MDAARRLVDSGLRTWKINTDRIESLFLPLSDDDLEREIAPGRNRLRYLWGHLSTVSDGMIPLLGIGARLHPELDAIFLTSPDRAATRTLAHAELKDLWSEIHGALGKAFSEWSTEEWLEKHTAVSDEDFVREPHRNRYSVLLNRTSHMAFHHGQAVLAKPR